MINEKDLVDKELSTEVDDYMYKVELDNFKVSITDVFDFCMLMKHNVYFHEDVIRLKTPREELKDRVFNKFLEIQKKHEGVDLWKIWLTNDLWSIFSQQVERTIPEHEEWMRSRANDCIVTIEKFTKFYDKVLDEEYKDDADYELCKKATEQMGDWVNRFYEQNK